MGRRVANFYNLKRPKLRASWNKINLYHINLFKSPVRIDNTLYKQKWVSKSASRKYHGETLGEKHWVRLFRPTVRSVVPMDAEALAADDGRKESAGRGLGREQKEIKDKRRLEKTKLAAEKRIIPYANMVYAQFERRLDMAVWRAMFASSTRQARQFCVHGYVKVNGQTMVYPGYMLNPGDMFQVEPDRVLFATGAGKESSQRREGRVRRRLTKKGVTVLEKRKKKENEGDPEVVDSVQAVEEPALDSRATLKKLLETSKVIASNEPDAKANRKRALRDFSKLVRKTMSRMPRGAASTVSSDATAQLRELMTTLNINMETSGSPSSRQPTSATPSRESRTTKFIDAEAGEALLEATKPKPAMSLSETQTVRSHEQAQLAVALQEARDNPIDATKPYATPWKPRPYMSPFAFVPRYLEVHHAICSAVYIRHPVARPGLAEVPTPFDKELLALAHNWYLRRR